MKYLQYLPNATESELQILLVSGSPNPSVLYAPNVPLKDKSYELLGYSISNNIIYKDNYVRYFTSDIYGQAYSSITITSNGKSFKSYENNGLNKIVPNQEVTMKVELDDDYVKNQGITMDTLSGYTTVFYILFDLITQDIVFKPQSYYDYLNNNNLTDEDMISKAKNDTDKSFMKECINLGFFVDPSYTKQVRLYIRGDIPQKIVGGENAVCFWLLPYDGYYNPDTGKFLT